MKRQVERNQPSRLIEEAERAGESASCVGTKKSGTCVYVIAANLDAGRSRL